MAWRIILYLILLYNVFAVENEKTRVVMLDDGGVVGTKYWDGDFYEFFGIPYAEAPTGRNRYQAPLPPKPWEGLLSADVKNVVCYQSYFTEETKEEFIVNGEDDCLLINLYVPEIASEENLVPVVVYVHSGAYAGGNGHMARFHYLARHDIIVISFNYRLGAIGFACLGNREIPGNAAMKDQVAALKWIKKNVKKFGGDPNKITLAGYSVGASMAELLTLSKTSDGLVHQLILDSASGLSPFAIDRDPIGTATNLAYAMGYNGTENLEDITEFYLNTTVEVLAAKSINFFLPNSTFGFAPCIENFHKGIEPFLTESPMDILRKGQTSKIPVLIGFSNMEGISRTIKFGEWREMMTKDFSDFLPADLVFDNEKTKQDVIAEIKKHYFNGEEVNHEKLQNYIDYFSDAMFKYSIMKSLKMRAAVSKRKMYLYEFNYIGKLNMQHNYMDRIKGASHRDQTAYILDFFGWTNNNKDLDMRDRMSIMWADFVTYGNPTEYENAVINYKWLPYTNENQNYLQITRKPSMKKNLFVDGYKFWDKYYEKYYWNPTAPKQPKVLKKRPEEEQVNKVNKSNDNKVANETKKKVQGSKGTKDSKVVNEKEKEDNNADIGKKAQAEKNKNNEDNNKQNIRKEKEAEVLKKQNNKDQVAKEIKQNENAKNNKQVEDNSKKSNPDQPDTNKIVKEVKKTEKINKDTKEPKVVNEEKKVPEKNKNNEGNKKQNIVKEKEADAVKKENNKDQVAKEIKQNENAKNKKPVEENNKKSNPDKPDTIKIVKDIKKTEKINKDTKKPKAEKK